MTETHTQIHSLPESGNIFPNSEFLCAPEEVQFSEAQLEMIDNWYEDSVVSSLHRGKDVPTKEEYHDKVRRWLTGNYDPKSGMHTLYRFVDQPGIDAMRQYGALTSRVVQYFGGGSDVKAVDQLESLVGGNITEETADAINGYFGKNKARSGTEYRSGTYLDSLTGGESGLEALGKEAKRSLLDIRATFDPDPDVLFGRVQEELLSSAASIEGTLYDLFHSSIHMTTEPYWDRWPTQYRISLKVLPGSVVPVGTFKQDNFVGIIPGGEWEWTTFGAAYPLNPEDLTVESVASTVGDINRNS